MGAFKQWTWQLLDAARPGDMVSLCVDWVIIALISLNILANILETLPSFYTVWHSECRIFETVSMAIFTVEYLGRVWSCTVQARFRNPILGRLRYMRTPLAQVDLIAILPFYFELFLSGSTYFDMRFLRAFRLVRIFSLAKATRYSQSLKLLGAVLVSKRQELVITTAIMVIMLVVSSTLMYYAEFPAQPEQFSSIPATMWWAVTTLSTVGYGDIAPITPLGKLLGSFVALLGIGFFALPTGILGSGFLDQVNKKKRLGYCPHCGEEL